MKNHLFYLILFLVFICGKGTSQSDSDQTTFPLNTGARYVSTGDGTIRMYVNVWGHVGKPGRILVDEGIDIATLFSLTGGPKKGANLKKISVYHEFPHKDGEIVHIINFTNFLKTGDRSSFISIHPNDTFIIKQTFLGNFVEKISTVNILMSLVNIYITFNNLFTD